MHYLGNVADCTELKIEWLHCITVPSPLFSRQYIRSDEHRTTFALTKTSKC